MTYSIYSLYKSLTSEVPPLQPGYSLFKSLNTNEIGSSLTYPVKGDNFLIFDTSLVIGLFALGVTLAAFSAHNGIDISHFNSATKDFILNCSMAAGALAIIAVNSYTRYRDEKRWQKLIALKTESLQPPPAPWINVGATALIEKGTPREVYMSIFKKEENGKVHYQLRDGDDDIRAEMTLVKFDGSNGFKLASENAKWGYDEFEVLSNYGESCDKSISSKIYVHELKDHSNGDIDVTKKLMQLAFNESINSGFQGRLMVNVGLSPYSGDFYQMGLRFHQSPNVDSLYAQHGNVLNNSLVAQGLMYLPSEEITNWKKEKN